MGYYINELPNGKVLSSRGKANEILSGIEGAEQIAPPVKWEENIVCVVENGIFDAAAYAFNEDEMKEFARHDGRPKTWLKVPNAKQLAK